MKKSIFIAGLLFLFLGGLTASNGDPVKSKEASNESKSHSNQISFGKGYRITALDSTFHLKIGFRMQSLMTSEWSANNPASTAFSIRRSRLKLDGWALNPDLVFKVELALSNKDLKSTADFGQTGEAPKIILDALVKWKFHDNFQLIFGQGKLPGNRERVVSSQKLQFVDRSSVNSIFNLDREMGIQLHSKFKSGSMVIKPKIALSMGEGRNIIDNNIGGFNYTSRVEFLPMGEFRGKGDYFQSDLAREENPKLALGVTYNVNQGASRQKTTGAFLLDAHGDYLTNDLRTIFVDAIFKYQGFSFFAEYADKAHMMDEGVTLVDASDKMIDVNGDSYYTGHGINFQAGYLLKSNWEIATRFTQVEPDWDKSFTGKKEYTLGLSKYIVGHSLKVQSDFSMIDKASSSDNSFRYRLQFEFGF